MRIIIKIARNELRNLFYSPVAWFLAIIFMVMCAFFYTGIMYPWAKITDIVYKNIPEYKYMATESVTEAIFSHPTGGFFVNILQHIFLFVPLLTMGIINREFNNGTIKLLYSSPVKLRQIVLGKYLAVITYNLLLVMIIGVFIVSGLFDIKSPDYGPLLSASLGFYLLLCALTAIGFFMSSLTAYQIVAAIASFTLLFILSRVGSLWQQYDFVRDLTYFLSISGRTEKMLAGLITTKDVIYYLIIIYLFISFTLIKLKGGRQVMPWYAKAGRYLAIVISGLLTGYISSRPAFTGYLDTTARKVNTIHPRTQEIIKELGDSTLEVTLYTNLFAEKAPLAFPGSRNAYLSQLWEQYQRFKPGIKFKYVYYYDIPPDDSTLFKKFPGKSLPQIAGLVAKGYQVDFSIFKTPEEMRKEVDLGAEDKQVIMQLKYKGRTTLLRTFPADQGFWPDEQNVNATFKRLLQARIPSIYFAVGELERSIYKKGEREYFAHTIAREKHGSLINMGFDVDTVNLAMQDIPADASLLVLADPRMELTPPVLSKLRSYISDGGNMLVLGKPGKQYVLNPLLARTGVQMMNGQLVQPTYNETPDKVRLYFTPAGLALAEELAFMKYKYLWLHNVRKDSLEIVLPGIAGLFYAKNSGFVTTPLLMTSPGKAWLKAGELEIDSTAPVFSPQEGDIKEASFPVSLQLSRKIKDKEQRIIICGDADFASNLRLVGDFVLCIYSWLNYNEFPVYTPVPYAKDNKVILSPAGAAIQKIMYVWVLPGLILLSGTVLLIRRRRK